MPAARISRLIFSPQQIGKQKAERGQNRTTRDKIHLYTSRQKPGNSQGQHKPLFSLISTLRTRYMRTQHQPSGAQEPGSGTSAPQHRRRNCRRLPQLLCFLYISITKKRPKSALGAHTKHGPDTKNTGIYRQNRLEYFKKYGKQRHGTVKITDTVLG